jgi:hypothetical protein
MSVRAMLLAALVAGIVLSGCSTLMPPTSAPISSLPPEVPIVCGPITDLALCHRAAELAAMAKLNPPPVASVRIRQPDPEDDACAEWANPCGAGTVIVDIQSGDTIQAIPLVLTGSGWVVLVPGAGDRP